MVKIPVFEEVVLSTVCDVLGDTQAGLTGSEIGELLQNCGIDDPCPGTTKRQRLFKALQQRQRRDQCANNVVAFIHAAMHPARYTHVRETFELRRAELNQQLAFSGLSLGEDGKLRGTTPARTLTEVQERASPQCFNANATPQKQQALSHREPDENVGCDSTQDRHQGAAELGQDQIS